MSAPTYTRPSQAPTTELFKPREWQDYLAIAFYPLRKRRSYGSREVIAKVVGFDYLEDLESGTPTRVVEFAVTSGRIAAVLEQSIGGCVVGVVDQGDPVEQYDTRPWVLVDLDDAEVEGYVGRYLAKMD